MQKNMPDVLILGGGVIGLATAYYLLKAGRTVCILERDSIGAATSFGNCGTITPSHIPPLAAPGMVLKAMKWMLTPDAPFYVKPTLDPNLVFWLLKFASRCNEQDWRASSLAKMDLLHNSRRLLESLVKQENFDCEFSATGMHNIYKTQAGFEKAAIEAERVREFGLEPKILSAEALAADEPALKSGMAGAVHYPGDAHLRPDYYTAELARVIRQLGGEIIEQCEVIGIETDHDSVQKITTSRGEYRAQEYLFALGPWSPKVLKAIGINLPVQPGKGYSITYSRPSIAPKRPIVLKERSVCVTTWGSGYRLGSTMEFSGYDDRLNRRRLDALERGADEYLREAVGPLKIEEWFGWRPMTWDDLPILGVTPNYKNAWLATGHGMLGVSMSTATGRLMTDLICRRAPIFNPAPYSIQRFVA
ncbi:MAG: NAD(P)/FAD-dependent oxidoreductase [Arenimonas sp.]